MPNPNLSRRSFLLGAAATVAAPSLLFAREAEQIVNVELSGTGLFNVIIHQHMTTFATEYHKFELDMLSYGQSFMQFHSDGSV